jgi:hypothetical protein
MTTIYDNRENNIINPMTELLRWIGLYHLVWVFNNEDIGIDLFQELTIRDLNEIGVTSDDDINIIINAQNQEYYNIIHIEG